MAATGSVPIYADHPLKTISTIKFETGQTDDFSTEASFMALSHNSFIRGFNSIYQQAPRISQSQDKQDFVQYCLAWKACVDHHHRYEETDFFPAIDQAAGQTGLMAVAMEQHAEFHDGLERFGSYLVERNESWTSSELIDIMDSFATAFRDHLAAEPQQIVDLRKYHTAERPINVSALALAAGKKGITPSFLADILPVYFLNMELREFEDGMWIGVFPPVNAAVGWLMMKGAPMWHGQKRWRFSSCDSNNAFKSLAV